MDKQKDKLLYVAFSTQKGGAGKTTLTVLMASYLLYVKGYDVAVIDCDFPQYSIHDMRKCDMDRISKDNYYSVFQFRMVAVDVGFINILEDIVHFGSFGIANCRACYFLSLRPSS